MQEFAIKVRATSAVAGTDAKGGPRLVCKNKKESARFILLGWKVLPYDASCEDIIVNKEREKTVRYETFDI